ncbi:hypothetical protein KS4_35690 [Poriferisphaera corsica]|uniref:Uncharacterized protein n=1 Tax=Poriferisphaera corsica TaxID=2528020 RepID=A0A517YZ36_9BACT|nr:hypothetical protein KS4_35690 [Poriferisphaera corsica]
MTVYVVRSFFVWMRGSLKGGEGKPNKVSVIDKEMIVLCGLGKRRGGEGIKKTSPQPKPRTRGGGSNLVATAEVT